MMRSKIHDTVMTVLRTVVVRRWATGLTVVTEVLTWMSTRSIDMVSVRTAMIATSIVAIASSGRPYLQVDLPAGPGHRVGDGD